MEKQVAIMPSTALDKSAVKTKELPCRGLQNIKPHTYFIYYRNGCEASQKLLKGSAVWYSGVLQPKTTRVTK